MRFDGRRILITGAASGIGQAIAERFARQGASLALLDLNAAGLDVLTSRLVNDGSRVIPIIADLADPLQIETAAARATNELGGLDTLVNAAGVDLHKPFAETGDAEWRRVMDVNLNGPALLIRALVPVLRTCGNGVVINIASGAGLRPLDRRVAYCTSKAALVMLTKSLALELAGDGIRANVICPGAIDTPLLHASLADDQAFDDVKQRYAMRRIGTPDDIAAAVLYLAGDEAGFVTGTTLTVDGGRAFH